MWQEKVSQLCAETRLKQFPHLKSILGDNWLAQQYQKKSVDNWSVITGWISEPQVMYRVFRPWLEDLDNALAFLKPRVSHPVWETISRKIRARSNRSNSHGTLAEIAVCRFFAENNFSFKLETNLKPQKDVDISAQIDGEWLHIEVQSLLYSDKSEKAATIAAQYRTGYGVDPGKEAFRVKRKICGKSAKFTESDITLVAIRSLDFGLDEGIEIVKKAVSEVYSGQNQKNEADTKRDDVIQRFVDGVIWFELESGKKLFPCKRGFHLNPHSPHRTNNALLKFIELWNKSGLL